MYWDVRDVNNSGIAIANLTRRTYDSEGEEINQDFAYRWDASGNAPTQLGNLGVDALGNSHTFVADLNDAGVVVGSARRFDAIGNPAGVAAVRWNVDSSIPIALQSVNPDANGHTFSWAESINSSGMIAGQVAKGGQYAPDGQRAVLWSNTGQIAKEFAPPPDFPVNSMTYVAQINNQGWGVGVAVRPDGTHRRTVRWDSTSSVGTVLGGLGVDEFGEDSVNARLINDSGTVIGSASDLGSEVIEVVRWNASSSNAVVLNPVVDQLDFSLPYAMNDAGTAVGISAITAPGNYPQGFAVRWDAEGAATPLGSLDLLSRFMDNRPLDINNSGISIGSAFISDVTSGTVTYVAVYWDYDGDAHALNSLIAPDNHWKLTFAKSISDAGWIVGTGLYDPDGAGPQQEYERPFLMNLPSIPGDYDRNLNVGPEDYLVWRTTYGSTLDQAADGNGDGVVNTADYSIWRDNLGTSYFGEPSGLGQVLPEPNTLVFALLFICAAADLPRASRYRR